MDSTAMDDKNYYVESPDGKVLGPMNMIQILEGIAAGVILDTARICEVGRQEWVDLSEVAYTHHEEPISQRRVPAAESTAGGLPSPLVKPGGRGPTDFGLEDLEPIGAEAELESLEIPDVLKPSDPTPVVEDSLLETPVPEAGFSKVPAPAETPVPFEAVPDAIEPFEPLDAIPTPAPDATPIAAEEYGLQELPEGGPDDSALRDLPVTPPPEDVPQDLPASAFPEDVRQDLPASAFPEDVPQDLPASAFPEDGPRELPASAFPADGPGAGAGDFQLEMAGAEEEDLEDEAIDAGAAPRSRKWIVPVAVALALPILAGIYHLAGGPSPFSKPAAEIADDPAATTNQAGPPSLTDEGWAALQAGKLKRAMNRFDAAIAENPEEARAHHGRGLAALRLGDTKVSIRSLERSLELDAASAQARTDLGQAQLASGQPELALASAQRVLDLDPAWAAARRLRGEAQLASGDAEAAVVTLTEHLRARPEDAAARLALANAFAETGRIEPALDEIQAYLAKHPEDHEADARRLDWFRSTGRLAEAALLYASLAAERPDDAHVQYLAGLAHSESDEGIAYLERSLALDGSNEEARAALKEFRQRLGRSERSTKRAVAPPPKRTRAVETVTAEPTPDVPVFGTPVVVSTGPVTPDPEPAPEPAATLASRMQEIQSAMDGGSVAAAREALEKAQAENLGDAGATRNLALWAAILDFHEGQLDAALAAFDKLDPSASYAAAGFGPGVIMNWQARANLAKGDVRGAIAVLDGVGRDDANEYATARLWEGVALASLGMTELAERTWQRVPEDVGAAVNASGKGAVKSAEFLAGAISAKDYRMAVGSIDGFENDMHFVLGFHARRSDDTEVARAHFRKVIESSRGHEFPYDLAQAEVAGTGLTGEWPAE